MRSELINEIFSIEAEAEKIVTEAQQNGRKLVSDAQSEGEKRLRLAIEEARKQREVTVAGAQTETERHIASERVTLESSEADNLDLQACADAIADRMVEVLCKTPFGDSVS